MVQYFNKAYHCYVFPATCNLFNSIITFSLLVEKLTNTRYMNANATQRLLSKI